MTAGRFRVLAAVLLVAVALGAAALYSAAAKRVPVYAAASMDLAQTVVATGRVETLARVEIGSVLLGTVTGVMAVEGQEVRAGEILVTLDDREARAAVEQAKAAVRSAEARIGQLLQVGAPVAEQAVRQSEANLAKARLQHERTVRLFDNGIIARVEMEEAQRALDVARGQVERDRSQWEGMKPQGGEHAVAEAALAEARAALAVAEERQKNTVIHAPASGRIIGRSVEKGDVVQPGRSLLVLSRPGETQVVAPIDEKNLGYLVPGQKARGAADAFPDRSFEAVLRTIVPAVDRQRGTVTVKLAVPSPPSYLLPDMTVSVEIEVARKKAALVLPADGVRETAGRTWVLQVRDGRAVARNVTLGIRGGGNVEVIAGLAAGDLVVAPSGPLVKEGDRVRPVRAAGGK